MNLFVISSEGVVTTESRDYTLHFKLFKYVRQ